MYLSSSSKEYLGEGKVEGVSRRGRGFIPRPIYVGFVVKKLHWDKFLSEYVGCPLPQSFHQSSALIR